jgi:hypothetical protein
LHRIIMPRYNYHPLSTDPERPTNTAAPLSVRGEDSFEKRRDICIGFLVLSAIVYVLARAGGDSNIACPPQMAQVALPVAHPSSSASSSSSHHDAVFDIGAYREKILGQSVPNIIECAEADAGGSQEVCHLPREKRFAALNQKGVTLWMTGLSGSGKSTIATRLEEEVRAKRTTPPSYHITMAPSETSHAMRTPGLVLMECMTCIDCPP